MYNKPTYGLDVANIRSARQRIRDAADAGVAAVLISTELEELLELADRIGVMNGGRLVGIVDNDENAEARVGHLMVGGTAAMTDDRLGQPPVAGIGARAACAAAARPADRARADHRRDHPRRARARSVCSSTAT